MRQCSILIGKLVGGKTRSVMLQWSTCYLSSVAEGGRQSCDAALYCLPHYLHFLPYSESFSVPYNNKILFINHQIPYIAKSVQRLVDITQPSKDLASVIRSSKVITLHTLSSIFCVEFLLESGPSFRLYSSYVRHQSSARLTHYWIWCFFVNL